MVRSISYQRSPQTMAIVQRCEALPPNVNTALKECAELRKLLPKLIDFIKEDVNRRHNEQVAHFLMGKINADQLPLPLQTLCKTFNGHEYQFVKTQLHDLVRTHRHDSGITGLLFGKSESAEKTIAKLEWLKKHLYPESSSESIDINDKNPIVKEIQADFDPMPVILGNRKMDGLNGKCITYTAVIRNPGSVEISSGNKEQTIEKPPFVVIDIHRLKITELNICPHFQMKRSASLTKEYSLGKAPSMRGMTLDMSRVILSKDQYEELSNFIMRHRELRELTLNLSRIRNNASASLAANKGINLPILAIKNLHKLEVLKLRINNMANVRSISVFSSTIAALKNPNKIKTLALEMKNWSKIKDALSGRTDNEFIEILHGVSRMKTLRHFSINIKGNYDLTDRGLDNIIEKFKEFEQLDSLDLTIDLREHERFFRLCDTFKSLKNLKIIKFEADIDGWDSTIREKARKALDEIRARDTTVICNSPVFRPINNFT